MNYSVPDTLLNKILQYLGNRPYVETFELIQAIQEIGKQTAPEPVKASEPVDTTSESEQQSN